MDCLGRPELNWYYSQRDKPAGEGVYGVWSAGTLDGWVGEDGPLIQSALGPKRVVELEGVPHAFCLSKSFMSVKEAKLTGSRERLRQSRRRRRSLDQRRQAKWQDLDK